MKKPVLLSLLLISAAHHSTAATLIQDDFSGTAGSDLIGTLPETGPGSWAGNTGFDFATGGGVTNNNTSSGGISATLDMGAAYFSSNPGIYEMTASVFFPAATAGTSVIGIGFAATRSAGISGSFADSGTFGEPWMFLRANGQVQVRSGATTYFSAATPTFASGSSHILKLVLNTTGSNWTLDAYVNSTQLDLNAGAGSTLTYGAGASPIAIRYAGITATQNTGIGTISNFQLTGTIPEPSSAALSSLGLLALCVSRKRR